MPHTSPSLQSVLTQLGSAYATYHTRFFHPHFAYAREKKAGVVRIEPCAKGGAYISFSTHDFALDTTCHQELEKTAAEQRMHALGLELAATFTAIPLLRHPRLCVTVAFERTDDPKKVGMTIQIDGTQLFNTMLRASTLAQRLQQRLDLLAPIPATGPFLHFEVDGLPVHAPNAHLALAKSTVLLNGEMPTLADAGSVKVALLSPHTDVRAGLAGLLDSLPRKEPA